MMRRGLTYLLAGLLFCSQAWAGSLVNPYSFSSAVITLTFIDCTEGLGGSGHTWTAHNVGTAGIRDTIVGVLSVDTAPDFGVTSVTVGGASATEIADEGGTGLVNSALYIVDNPTGTSEDIEVVFSESMGVDRSYICVWAAYNLNSETAVASTVDDHTSGGDVVLNLSDTIAGGIAVGVCANEATSQTTTWTGLTERADISSGQPTISAADVLTSGGALSITCDGTSSFDISGAAASFF